ncbi:hypothetical protein T492DRAFT_1151000 [Pavlovales sp. CCMP2436]|nr:hypothetical protein T492DRAFT_1151000 [Pavlovales sp. CCMP2436]
MAPGVPMITSGALALGPLAVPSARPVPGRRCTAHCPSGLLAMLEEEQLEIKAFALQKLNAVVDDFWAEISECLPDMCAAGPASRARGGKGGPGGSGQRSDCVEDSRAADRGYRHTLFLSTNNVYATGDNTFGQLGNGTVTNSLVPIMVPSLTNLNITSLGKPPRIADGDEPSAGMVMAIDSRLVAIVGRMFESCFTREQYKQALGIAIEARRLDVIYRALTREALPVPLGADVAAVGAAAVAAAEGGAPFAADADAHAMLEHCLHVCKTSVASREFRTQLLRLLVTVFRRLPVPDYLGLCECLTQLGDAKAVAQVLGKLLLGSQRDFLLACQTSKNARTHTGTFICEFRPNLALALAQVPSSGALALYQPTKLTPTPSHF